MLSQLQDLIELIEVSANVGGTALRKVTTHKNFDEL